MVRDWLGHCPCWLFSQPGAQPGNIAWMPRQTATTIAVPNSSIAVIRVGATATPFSTHLRAPTPDAVTRCASTSGDWLMITASTGVAPTATTSYITIERPGLLAAGPEPEGRDPGAFRKSRQFGPHHVGSDAARPDVDAEATVGSGHDVVTPREVGVASDSLGDQVRVLNVV